MPLGERHPEERVRGGRGRLDRRGGGLGLHDLGGTLAGLFAPGLHRLVVDRLEPVDLIPLFGLGGRGQVEVEEAVGCGLLDLRVEVRVGRLEEGGVALEPARREEGEHHAVEGVEHGVLLGLDDGEAVLALDVAPFRILPVEGAEDDPLEHVVATTLTVTLARPDGPEEAVVTIALSHRTSIERREARDEDDGGVDAPRPPRDALREVVGGSGDGDDLAPERVAETHRELLQVIPEKALEPLEVIPARRPPVVDDLRFEDIRHQRGVTASDGLRPLEVVGARDGVRGEAETGGIDPRLDQVVGLSLTEPHHAGHRGEEGVAGAPRRGRVGRVAHDGGSPAVLIHPAFGRVSIGGDDRSFRPDARSA